MTIASTADTAPIGTFLGLPLYKHGTAPAHLRTKTMLTRIRLQPAPDQRPVCYVIPYYHPDEYRALYEPADADPVVRSIGDEWAWRARRTCHRCGSLREFVLNGHQCGDCSKRDRERTEERHKRTCSDCKHVGTKSYPMVKVGWYPERLCRFCVAKRNRLKEQLLRKAIRCPGGCGRRTATKREVLDWCFANHQAIGRWVRRCEPCEAAHRAEVERQQAEQRARWAKERAEEKAREEAARQARKQELADLAAWAAAVLADPTVVILDTETTGLGDDARIVDIAVTTMTGETLLDTLVNPSEPIPPSATAIHGITDAMVADAPSFADLADDVRALLAGKRVIIYNAQYDMARLAHEFSLLCDTEAEAAAVAEAVYVGVAGINAEDAMVPYSDWVGEWSDWHGNYRWQPLSGGHRALGDCLAVIECLKAMAASVRDEEGIAA